MIALTHLNGTTRSTAENLAYSEKQRVDAVREFHDELKITLGYTMYVECTVKVKSGGHEFIRTQTKIFLKTFSEKQRTISNMDVIST